MITIEKGRDAINSLTSLIATAGGIGILAVSLIILLDVVLRVTLNHPIEGLGDIVKFSFAVIIASFYPVGLSRSHNVTIRFLGKALGSRWELVLDAFGALVTLFVVTMMAWKIYGFTVTTTRDGLTTLTLEMPQAPFWWAVTAIFLFCVPVQFFLLTAKILEIFSGRRTTENPS